MTLPTGPERDFEQAKLLLEEYCFDLSGFHAGELVAIWQERLEAEPSWIRAAVLEALYQGRYKAFSVEQILQGWKRRGHPVRHFNSEFERVVFGPIDPTISKYAAMTTFSPSELMAPQPESREPQPSSGEAENAIAPSPPAHTASESTADEVPTSASPSFELTPKQEPMEDLTPPAPTDPTSAPSSTSEKASAIAALIDTHPPHHSAIFSQPTPIRKFVPQSDDPEFYHRLQSVAKRSQ
jgi:hypothetical protein